MGLKMPPEKSAASAASEKGQRRYRTIVVASLVLLVVASIGGLISDRVGGWVSAVGFAASLLLTAVGTTRWQHEWHGGRALAERAKSVTWKYAVGGAPFGLDAEGVDSAYAEALSVRVPRPADFADDAPPPKPDEDAEMATPQGDVDRAGSSRDSCRNRDR